MTSSASATRNPCWTVAIVRGVSQTADIAKTLSFDVPGREYAPAKPSAPMASLRKVTRANSAISRVARVAIVLISVSRAPQDLSRKMTPASKPVALGITSTRFANLATRAVPIAKSGPTTVHRVLRHYSGKGRIVSKIVPAVLNPPRDHWSGLLMEIHHSRAELR